MLFYRLDDATNNVIDTYSASVDEGRMRSVKWSIVRLRANINQQSALMRFRSAALTNVRRNLSPRCDGFRRRQ